MVMLRKLYWTEQSSDAYRTELELKTNREHSAAGSSTGSDQRRRNFSDHISTFWIEVLRGRRVLPSGEVASAGGCRHWHSYDTDMLGPQFSADRGISSRAAEFGRCRGISMFPRNFTEFEEIPRNDQILYCCCNCNCDLQSIHRQLQRPVDFSDVFWHSLCLLTHQSLISHQWSLSHPMSSELPFSWRKV